MLVCRTVIAFLEIKSMMLPCHHIFVLLNKLEQPLYSEDICDRHGVDYI